MKLFYIINKNFKLLTRNKGSALVVLLGPLALMLLISLSFNNSTLFDIKIGAYSESYSELSESVLAQLEDEQYKVVKLESEQECIDSVKSENLQLCLSIPKDLDVKSSESLTFYVDNSKINLVYLITNTISSKISLKSEELSTDLTTQIVNVLNDANVKIAAESPNIPSVETTLSSTESKIAEVNSQISGLKSISSEVSNVKTSINASNSDFANLTSLASELDSKIAELKSSSNDLSSLSSQIALEKEKINRLNSALNSILTNINSIEIEKIVNPISTEITPITSGSTHLGNAFPILLMIVLMFTGIVLSAATVMDEKTSKAYLRNYISPTPSILFIIGDYIFSLLIMILQIIVIFLVVILATKAPVNYTELLNVLGAIILIASVFILLGMFIGYIFKNSETSNMASIS